MSRTMVFATIFISLGIGGLLGQALSTQGQEEQQISSDFIICGSGEIPPGQVTLDPDGGDYGQFFYGGGDIVIGDLGIFYYANDTPTTGSLEEELQKDFEASRQYEAVRRIRTNLKDIMQTLESRKANIDNIIAEDGVFDLIHPAIKQKGNAARQRLSQFIADMEEYRDLWEWVPDKQDEQ